MYYQGESIKIAPITESCLPQVLEIYQQCEDFLALGPIKKASMNMVQEDFDHSMKENGLFCGIYDLNEKMIGIVDFVPDTFEGIPKHAFISLIMIAKPYRNNGIGKKVIEVIENKMRDDLQIKTILSAVQTNNERALKFWENIGFSIVGGPETRPDNTVVYKLRKDL